MHDKIIKQNPLHNSVDGGRGKLKFYIKMMLKRKLLIIILLLVLFLLSVSLYCEKILIDTYNLEVYEANSRQITTLAKGIEDDLEDIEENSFAIMSNSIIQSNLSELNKIDQSEGDTRQKTSNYLTNIHDSIYDIQLSSNIYSLAFDINGQVVNWGAFNANELSRSDYIEQAEQQYGKVFWVPILANTPHLYCIRTIREIQYLKLKPLATLFLEVDFSKLVQLQIEEAGFSKGNSDEFLIFQENELIYSTKENTSGDLFEYENIIVDEILNQRDQYLIMKIGGEEKFISVGTIEGVNWKLVHVADYNTIFSTVERAQQLNIVLFITASVLAIVTSYIIFSRLTKHFTILEKKMMRFGAGDFTPLPLTYDYSNRGDEIGSLHRRFDKTIELVNELVNDNYIKQMLLQETQIQALQQQINPHFLYNTLDSIYWMGQKDCNEEICQMVQGLAHLFRGAITNDGDVITLEKELDFLMSYIKIQSIRFKERLVFENHIGKQYFMVLVPKLSIQPLVENAINYSMEYSPDACQIYLDMQEKDNSYYITVKNTGSYFEEDILNKLKRGEVNATGSGIGLLNIDKRLKLIYGVEYGIMVYNEQDRAVVVIVIPKEFSKKGDLRNDASIVS